MRTKTYLFFSTLILTSMITLSASSAEPDLKRIMQDLRDDALEITDGLLTDDFSKVAAAAVRIANHDRIPGEQIQRVAAELGPEMSSFKQFDNVVHELSVSIAAAAEEKDSEKAIADYQRMLNNCYGCHAAYKARVSKALGSAN